MFGLLRWTRWPNGRHPTFLRLSKPSVYDTASRFLTLTNSSATAGCLVVENPVLTGTTGAATSCLKHSKRKKATSRRADKTEFVLKPRKGGVSLVNFSAPALATHDRTAATAPTSPWPDENAPRSAGAAASKNDRVARIVRATRSSHHEISRSDSRPDHAGLQAV